MRGPKTMTLGEILTVSQVEDTYRQLKELLTCSSQSSIELDASELVKVDCAGVQLLTAFIRFACEHKKDLEITNAPPVLLDSFKVLGLTNELDSFLAKEIRED